MAAKLDTSDGSDQHNSPPVRQNLPRKPRAGQREASLERGTRLLATLLHAARAARLEAEAAELQAALAEARNGDPRRLDRWLNRFDAAGGFDSPVAHTTDAWQIDRPAGESPLSGAADVESQPLGTPLPASAPAVMPERLGALGWAPYLVHARRRLQELESREPQALVDLGIHLKTDDLQLAAGEADRGDSPDASQASRRLGARTAQNAAEVEPSTDEAAEDELSVDAVDPEPWAPAGHDADKDVEGAIEELDLTAIENLTKELEPAAAVGRPLLSGFGLSLTGHLALLTLLFLITLRLPDQSASLGSQLVSVAAPAEELELTAEFDSLEPIEMELEEVVEPNIAPADSTSSSEATALSEITTAVSETGSLLNAATSAAQSSSSAAAMLSAAVGGGGGAGRAAGSRGGPPAMSSTGGKFFGAGAGGNFFCYVVDSSGSMRGAAWESAKAELVRSISTLSEKQRFYIVFFAKEFSAIPEPGGREAAAHGLAATRENIEHARRWIETVKLDRGGPPNDALELAIAREPDAIYLLTDGVTQVDVCGFLRECNRTSDIISGPQVRVPIHAIAYHSLDGQQLLRRLAQENAGQFHYVPAR